MSTEPTAQQLHAVTIFERIAAWSEHRARVSADEDAGHARAGDWHDSDDTAVALLEELADLFDQTRPLPDDGEGAVLVAVLGTWTRRGLLFPLHPDENGPDWWIVDTSDGGSGHHVPHPDVLRDYAEEGEAMHAAQCETPDAVPCSPALDDCIPTAAGYRLAAALMDRWHAANPDPT